MFFNCQDKCKKNEISSLSYFVSSSKFGKSKIALSAGAVEYTDCTSAEG